MKASRKNAVGVTSRTKGTRWIAERHLERCDAVGGTVVVRIGVPSWPPGAGPWKCPFVILGLGDESIRFGYSEDSMGAIQNALRGIRSLLAQSGIPLRWELEGAEVNDTGFALDADRGYGLAFQQRIEQMILDEEAKLPGHRRERQDRERRERREARRKARPKPRTE
jgi:hypothetical protein